MVSVLGMTAQEALAATHAGEDSKVMGPAVSDSAPRAAQVVFYRLARKFVDSERNVPEQSENIMYYTLSVGHHTGVIDCFEEAVSCSLELYERTCGYLLEGDGRYKMEGILRSGEIQVDSTNIATLEAPLSEAAERAREAGDKEALGWLMSFSDEIAAISENAAVYLMGRVRE